MSEELLVVLEHLIQTAIQDVLFYQRVIFIQQISLRALFKTTAGAAAIRSRVNWPC
jgi:hypothetical protein